MKKEKIVWMENGWTVVQEADAKKHILEVSCRAENGVVTEVRIRHNDGEETKGRATALGKDVLPLPLAEFRDLYTNGQLTFR